MNVGTLVYRFRWLIILAWLTAAAMLVWLVPAISPSANERTTFLPADTPHARAVMAMGESFPEMNGLSEAVIVFERRERALNKDDLEAIERVADLVARPTPQPIDGLELAGLTVRSPRSVAMPANPLTGKPIGPNPLISKLDEAGQAAIVHVSIPANFITLRSAGVVAHIRGVLERVSLPQGLAAAVTGSSGFGHDYAKAAEKSHRQTLIITLLAVMIILVLVYGAPVAAIIPLGAISLAAVVAMKLLAIGENFGMHVGTAEKIFVCVLIYGAGVDYSLLLISRYREFLDTGLTTAKAAPSALSATFAAILASAGTDIAGLSMLSFAEYGIFRTTGPAVAVALAAALLAAVTLVPAMVSVFGKAVFWPKDKLGRGGFFGAQGGVGRGKGWAKIARVVTVHPKLVMLVTLVVLLVPAVRGTTLTWVYDTLAGLQRNDDEKIGNATVGIETARRHWPIGQIAPVTILLRAPRAIEPAKWEELCRHVAPAAGAVKGVRDIRSLVRPLGKEMPQAANSILTTLGRPRIRKEYLSGDMRAMRLVAVLDSPALTLDAMREVREIREAVAGAIADDRFDAELHLTGATAEMIDLRQVTQSDFHRISIGVLSVIFLMILALLRDAVLSAFMVASTVLSYLATLGISYWVLVGLCGAEGLDWKVQVFLFVVMVAVGQDYNIFLAARLAEEARRLPTVEATRVALARTGPVISSCGLIMAATLGSLAASELALLVQLGFALATGMLIDTFIVRPLLLPAFVVLTGRTGRRSTLSIASFRFPFRPGRS